MTNITRYWRFLAAAAAAAAVVAACNDGGGIVPPQKPVSSSIGFTAFAHSVFYHDANSMTVATNALNFDFDSNDDPTAFDDLIAAGTF